LREIAAFPSLTADDERQLGRQIQLNGDEAAVSRLVEANLRFVANYAKRFRGLGVPLLDLIHEGNLGLIEAARRFRPDEPRTFQSGAVWWVRQAVMHLLAGWPGSPETTTSGLMAAAVAGRHPDAIRVAIEHAQHPSSSDEMFDPHRRGGRRTDRQSRRDAGACRTLHPHAVLRCYLN
ncbi:MAG: sigma-70 family RNA polymerase sigma factor, partial [Vicinamibacterales bacterium]